MRPGSAKLRSPNTRALGNATPMHWFRTIGAFIRVLIGLFMIAQLAGVVSSPLASPRVAAATVTPLVHHHDHHAHPESSRGPAGEHGHHPQGHADDCCALHAFFAGVLPSVATVEDLTLTGERMTGHLPEGSAGITPGGLDRPPKPLP